MSGTIALFMPTLRGGGAERNMLRLASGLVDHGFEVTVVVADVRGPNRPWLPPGAGFVDFGVRFLPTSVLPLSRWLKAHRPGAVLSAVNGANVVALAARRIARVDVPVVISERNTLTEWRADIPSLQRRWIIPWLVRRLYPEADRILAVSRASARDLATYIGVDDRDVQVIGNPVVDSRLAKLAAEPLPARWDAALSGSPLLVSVGRLVRQKNPEMLLRAFAIVRRQIPNARLVFLGDGPLRRATERSRNRLGLRDVVDFAGFQDNPYPWMSRADVVALSSRYEGLPTVLIEALACGARVVATDAPGGAAEILDDGRWGSLVDVDDVEGFAAALLAELRAGRWPQPPKAALERYRLDTIVLEYRAILDPILAG